MQYNDFLNTIYNSKLDDWEYNDLTRRWIYKPNINISIIPEMENNYSVIKEDFSEEWTDSYCNNSAYSMYYLLQYKGITIDKFYVVITDGGRYAIPLIESRYKKVITKKQYKIGRILNNGNSILDKGLKIAKIIVEQ